MPALSATKGVSKGSCLREILSSDKRLIASKADILRNATSSGPEVLAAGGGILAQQDELEAKDGLKLL